MEKKQFKVIVIGAGGRGTTYTNIMGEVPEMFKDAEPKAIRGQLDKIRDSANELSQDMNRIMEEQQKAKRSRDDGAR